MKTNGKWMTRIWWANGNVIDEDTPSDVQERMIYESLLDSDPKCLRHVTAAIDTKVWLALFSPKSIRTVWA